MARSGSFGTSLNPFGTGAFGGLSQYDIGDSLKDLEAYRLEIAWGNGDITDEEYAASLTRLLAAATPAGPAPHTTTSPLPATGTLRTYIGSGNRERAMAVWLIVKGFNPSAMVSESAKVDVN